MRILAFSDIHAGIHAIHNFASHIDSIDLLVGAGDYGNMRKGLQPVVDAIAALNTPTLLVHGNAESAHELQLACDPYQHLNEIHNQHVTINNHTFFGLGAAIPVTPFGDWSVDLSEKDAAAILNNAPQHAVLIAHSPPHGYADRSSSGAHIGSTAVRDFINSHAPTHILCGHVHASWGTTAHVNTTTVMNLGPRGTIIELD